MKAYWDSSAIVQSTSDVELRKRLRKEGGLTRSHTIAEVFSVLTAGGLTVRVDAEKAATLIENIATDLEFIDLAPDEVIFALKDAKKRGVRGGRVHDYMHALAAKKSGAQILLTLDRNDFKGLVDSLGIEEA